MATVYLAVRDDDQYDKRVAIKLVRGGIAPGPMLDWFRHERQILANLDHPYIARLLDGGSTARGVPYFVMEYVEGVPIDVYCDDHDLDLERRCELFRKVCEAVSYAHRNLVIHRDLKPGNLLVTSDGTPKLLDFRIAKLLTPDGSRTVYGGGLQAWAMTPDYASPEQVRGEPVSTATDVYSLGALLYRLLSGSRAHALETYSPGEVDRVVCRDEPVKPSCIATRPGWRSRISGDLDNIVLMAMRKEPGRRYATVDQFSEDVRRYLAGLPVAARDNTSWYRTGKFIRRHRFAAAAMAAAMVSIAIGSAASLWQARQAGEARRVAEQERAEAEEQTREAEREHILANVERDRAVKAGMLAAEKAKESERARAVAEARLQQLVELANRSVFDIQGAIARLPGGTEARRQIAKTTLEFLDGLARDAGGDARVLGVVAQAYARLGDVQGMPSKASLGNTTDALNSYKKAGAILQRLSRMQPHDPALQVRVAQIDFRLGAALVASSRSKDGIDYYERGLAVARGVLGRYPNRIPALQQVAVIQQELARASVQTDIARAAVFAQAQLESYRKLAGLRPDSDEAAQDLASAYSMSGTVVGLTGSLEQAVDYHRQCAAIRERLAARQPNNVELQRDLMLAYGHVGDRLGYPLVPNLHDPRGAKAYY
jgi:tetratricopeptide (TPR) repeat protein